MAAFLVSVTIYRNWNFGNIHIKKNPEVTEVIAKIVGKKYWNPFPNTFTAKLTHRLNSRGYRIC
jgi:hypothetical protein